MLKKKFTIIIPVIKKNKYLIKNLIFLNKQIFKNFDVIIVSESNIFIDKNNFNYEIKILKKNIINPGAKRNFAAKHAEGKYLAFIDDDAYPNYDWLQIAHKKILSTNIKDKFILGGPGILPDDENLFSIAVDYSFRSLIYGNAKLRYESVKKIPALIDDWPSVNMIISKIFFLSINGFDENHWPGEDSKLCNKLLNKNGRIIYLPSMIVKHYRRSTFVKHYTQIFRYAFTRGIFFKNKDKNSYKINFLLPSLFLFYFISLFFVKNFIFYIPLFSLIIFLFFENFFILKSKKLILSIVSAILIILNILIYGLGFCMSFFLKNYKTKLGR